MKRLSLLSTLVLVCPLANSTVVTAQTGAPPPPHQSMMHRMMGHFGHSGAMGHKALPMGRIIGNKTSHVYHLPGDKGTLPAEKNRVYFRTEKDARAAGYRPAGASPMGSHRMGGHSMSHTKMGHP